MWIASQYGFFSVVKDHHSDVYKVRSRSKNDLLELFPADRIITTHDSDYRHRVILDKKELNDFINKCSDIEYTNFKDHIATLPTQKDKKSYYSRIWSVMFEYQNQRNE